MLVALMSSSDALVVPARVWTNATDGSLSGANKPHRRCAADETSEKAAPRVLCMQRSVWSQKSQSIASRGKTVGREDAKGVGGGKGWAGGGTW